MPIILFFIFLARGLLFLDPDFGWHLRNGELMATQGIIRVDPYSYTMPTYPVVSHEWTIDILWNFLVTHGGGVPLSIIWALIPVAVLCLIVNKYKTGRFLTILLAATTFLQFYGNRPQVVGWLFFAIVLHLLLYVNKRQKFFVPLIFILWANIHGSFAAGLVALWIIILVQRRNFLLGIVSTAITLINPFGIGIWEEVWSSVSDSALRWRIGEWQPAIFSFHPQFLLLLVITSLILMRYRKKFSGEIIALFIFFLVQALSSVRHVPLLVIVSVPAVLKGFLYLTNEAKKKKEGIKRLNRALKVLNIITLLLCLFFGWFIFKDTPRQDQYPVKAVSYLKDNQTQGNIFATYNWGGYLIWKYPQKKVFIDGRMPSWKTGSYSAMDEQIDILAGTIHFKYAFEKYGVDTVLWDKQANKNSLVSTWAKDITATLFGFTPAEYDFLRDLERNQWKKIYEDEIAVIYRR